MTDENVENYAKFHEDGSITICWGGKCMRHPLKSWFDAMQESREAGALEALIMAIKDITGGGRPKILTKGKPKSLNALKPAFTCKCGEEYQFLVPTICRKCFKEIPIQPGTVPFSQQKYQEFACLADKIGVVKAIQKLKRKKIQ